MFKVLVDIDGVVLNLHEGVRRFLARQGKNFYPENVTDYDYSKCSNLGCNATDIYDSFHDPCVYVESPIYSGVVHAIDRLKHYYCTEAYTSSIPNSQIKKMREMLLDRLELDYPEVYDLKKPVLLDDTLAVFDDNPNTLRQWIDSGYSQYFYLIKHPYSAAYYNTHHLPSNVILADSLAVAVADLFDRTHPEHRGMRELVTDVFAYFNANYRDAFVHRIADRRLVMLTEDVYWCRLDGRRVPYHYGDWIDIDNACFYSDRDLYLNRKE